MKSIQLNDIQYRFWIDNLLRADNAYNVAYSFCIKGSLQVCTLKQSLELLTKEYEPFHATIQQKDMHPYFFIDNEYSNQFTLRECNEVLSDTEINSIIDQQAQIPFHLDQEYPCRFFLLKMPDRSILLTLFHHIVMDGLTMFDFCNRLSTIYNSLIDRKDINTQPSLLTQFNSEWDTQYSSEQRDEDINYWVEYLKNAPLHLPIPYSNSTEDKEDETYFFTLGKSLHNAVDAFCKQYQTTRFRLYSAVWLTVLNYFLQTDDLVLDHTLHLRPKNYQNLLGSFVNNLPIRVSMDTIQTFHELLDFIKENRHNEQKHQKAIYTNIISSLRNKKLLSETHELFNIGIDYPIRNHSLIFDFRDCNVSFYRQTLSRMLGDICLVIEDDELFSCSIRFKSTIEVSYIEQMAQAFGLVLEQVLQNPYISIRKLCFITNKTKLSLLEQSEVALHKHVNNSKELSFNDMFAYMVSLYPTKTALRFNGEDLSYQIVSQQSDKIAHFLISQHPGEKNIGIAMKRGASMIIAALGVLKAGCTYVPLDLANPHQRLSFILQDCNIQTILCDGLLPLHFDSTKSISINSIEGELPNNTSLPHVKSNQNAYIIYTSGTTGMPKGIPITHGQMSNLIQNEKVLFQLTPDSIVLQYASINFDASITETFTTLATGSTLVIASEEQQKDPLLLTQLIEQENISCATIPPSLLPVLAHKQFPKLKTMIVGGESTSAEAIKYWRKNRRFINAYGPTENTVDTTICIMDETTPANDIGTPLPGVSCYILDKDKRLLPNNVPGELYIGGIQLTKGYINRPELNKSSFIPNPFVSQEDKDQGINTHLYKSGDLVVRSSNGHLLFLGRTDHQVKIRGLRIELGEIENNLAKHSAIKQAFVTTSVINGEKQLVAYVQPLEKEKQALSIDELKQHLALFVPNYMIPAYWCVLDAFPTNVNGKIDRNALPQPKLSETTKIYEAPKTVAEVILSHIVAEIMNIPQVSINDDLFNLGITSIQVMHIVFEAEKAGIQTSVSKFYQFRTIRSILNNKRSTYCYWGNTYQPDKPLLLLVCGYPYFKPSFDEFATMLGEHFSLLVLESYNEYFLHKSECTLDKLLDAYISMLRPVLKDKELFAITGLCIGGEMGIPLAYKLQEEGLATPKVFVLDGFADRGSAKSNGFIEEPDTDMEVNMERNRISDELEASFAFKPYTGEIHICLAKHFTKHLRFAHLPEETDPVLLQYAFNRFSQNAQLWRDLFPTCTIDYIDADHWNILKSKASNEILHIMLNSLNS